jgi:anti-sigma28 factor (negative regulator of flagellin synthesis)
LDAEIDPGDNASSKQVSATHQESSNGNQSSDQSNEAVSKSASRMVLRSASTSDAARSSNLTNEAIVRESSIDFGTYHFFLTIPFTQSSNPAIPEAMADAYVREKTNWSESQAYRLEKSLDVPQDAKIIGSHVIHKY